MARRLAHVSDLHFGRTDESLVEPLLQALAGCRPDLVVVSGDLTQRATREEFACAKRFLDRLPAPALVVPGNHDIPLWNAPLRFAAPRRRWSHGLGLPWTRTHRDEELIVVGIDSTSPWRAKQGAVTAEQLEFVKGEMASAPETACRVVVLHHPLKLPQRMNVGKPHVIGADVASDAFRDCGTDVIMAGHMHVSGFDQVIDTKRDGLLHVLAPSAISTRLRGEVNGFNVLDIDMPHLKTTLHSWSEEARAYIAKDAIAHLAGAREAETAANA